ncbi:hypothetical protein [Nonomuraea typhae]|uniref:Uncharacterized protein n=1 Tax=Nonomuraea typhae TaxID=2603600 RepID=A0ABW7Z9A0_9ACTN
MPSLRRSRPAVVILSALVLVVSLLTPAHAWTDFVLPATAAENNTLVSVARKPGNLDVFWIRDDGAVMTTVWSDSWPVWETRVVAPAGSAQPGSFSGGLAAVARNPDHLDVFWIRPDSGVSTSWWDAAAPQWAVPRSISPSRSAMHGTLAAAARNPGQLDVFWITPAQAIGTTAWNPVHDWRPYWTITPNFSAHPLGGAVSVVSRARDHLDLFWVRPDGGVSTAWWHAQANWPSRSIAPGGHVKIGSSRAPVRSALTAISRRPDHLDVFWIGPDGGIGTTAWNPHADWPAPWPIAWPGAAAPGGLSATSRSPGQIDLVWITPDGRVQHLSYDERLPGAWTRLAAASAQRALPGPISLVGRRPDHLDAFYVRPDRSLGSAWWHTERVRVHLKLVNLPGHDMTPITNALNDARTVLATAELGVELGSVERIQVTGMDDVDVRPCRARPDNHQVSTEQASLASYRANASATDVVLYVVGSITPAGVTGCGTHPAGQPGAVIRYDAGRWTLAHELAHVIALSHVPCGVPPCSQHHNRLMWDNFGFLTKPVPELVADEKTLLYESPLTFF